MGITLQNLPFYCVLWIGIGFACIIIGILMIASQTEASNHYVEFSNSESGNQYNKDVEELFSYFLEEEEKKNQGLREMLLEVVDKKHLEESSRQNSTRTEMPSQVDVLKKNNYSYQEDLEKKGNEPNLRIPAEGFNEIIKLHNEGLNAEEIAKKLKKGVGEVKLMISLYMMR